MCATPALFYEHAHIKTGSTMRISAEAKAETRRRIIEAALDLFGRDGWENTTTRQIAAEAGIATGTLFNYFESKEAIVAFLMLEALTTAQQEFRKRRSPSDSLEEELFSLIWVGFRSLRRFRKILPEAAETIFSPLRRSTPYSPGETIRVSHLEAVAEILRDHGVPAPLPPITIQLFWMLYLGVFSFWSSDDSPKQEDTLALLDHSLKLFTASLRSGRKGNKNDKRQSQGSHHSASPGKRTGTNRS
jgi:AcrR family transcriptional regulator